MVVSRRGRGPVIGGVMTIVGSVMTILGTVLPWEHIDAGLAAAANASSSPIGVEFDDGKIFVFAGILTIVASGCWLAATWLPAGIVGPLGRLLGNGAALSALTGGYIVSFAILNLRDIAAEADRLNGLVSGSASVGTGIYLDLAGGVVIVAGAVIGLLVRRD